MLKAQWESKIVTGRKKWKLSELSAKNKENTQKPVLGSFWAGIRIFKIENAEILKMGPVRS